MAAPEPAPASTRMSSPATVSLPSASGTRATRPLAPPATLAVASSPTAVSTTTTCTDGRWPLAVLGVPTLWHAGAGAGDYLWHDANGWHLRVTHRGTTRFVFTGRIVSSAPMTA